MPYSDLVIQGTVTTAEDCGSFTVVDNTGFFPESAGGYADFGEGTATRPEYLDIHLFFVLRVWLADGTFEDFYPETQPDPDPYPSTVEWSLLDEFGEPSPDQIYQGFWVVAPADVSFEAALILAENDGVSLVEYALVNWGVGSFPIPILCSVINCTNDALRRLNNAAISGACETEEWETKDAALQGIYSNVALAGGATILSQTQADYYTEAENEVLWLTDICNDETCKCNC